jgi:hypothetical protein
MKNKRNKEMIIDDLAAIAKKGFDEVNAKLSIMDKKIEKLQQEVLEIKADLEDLKK